MKLRRKITFESVSEGSVMLLGYLVEEKSTSAIMVKGLMFDIL